MPNPKVEIDVVAKNNSSPAIKEVVDSLRGLESSFGDLLSETRAGTDAIQDQAEADRQLAIAEKELAEQTDKLRQEKSELEREAKKLAAAEIEAANAAKKMKVNLEELGGKIQNVGTGISAIFTLPIVAGFALMTKSVMDANAEFEKLGATAPPAVQQTAAAFRELQIIYAPINAEFQKTTAELLTGLLPVIRELQPALLGVAKGMSDLARQFAALPIEQKNLIVGFVGITAAIGPVIFAVGQVIMFVGQAQAVMTTLGVALPAVSAGLQTFGASAYAALGPVGALVAASAALIALWNSDFSQPAKQAFALAWGGWSGMLGGDAGQGVLDASKALGVKGFENSTASVPSPSQARNVQVVYAPMISTADQNEAQKVLGPLIGAYLKGVGIGW